MRNLLLAGVLRFFGLKKSNVSPDRKGTVLILIDGLGFREMKRAIAKGYCPFFRKLLRGSYRLKPYFCGLPAATTATEAELFFGNHDNIPGFTWYDRALGRIVRGNRGRDIEEFEKMYRKQTELLQDGSCILGVFSAGATQMRISGSDLDNSRPSKLIGKLHILFVVLLNPFRLVYTVYLILKSVFASLVALFGTRSKSRFRRVVTDSFTHIFLGNITTYIAELELARETPILFVDYLLYDEFAHEYGIGRSATNSSLKLINWYCKSIYESAKRAKRRYDIIILSDHGQTLSRPYEKLAAGGLERLVSRATGLPEDKIVKTLGPLSDPDKVDGAYLIPAGSTLQIYFAGHLDRPLNRSDLKNKYPQLEKVLLDDPQIGWLLVRYAPRKGLLLGKSGQIAFSDGRVESIAGTPFPGNTVSEDVLRSLARYASYENNGDIVLFGNAEGESVIAFEPHESTHGGFVGDMTVPFIMTDRKEVIAEADTDNSMEKVFEAIRFTHNPA